MTDHPYDGIACRDGFPYTPSALSMYAKQAQSKLEATQQARRSWRRLDRLESAPVFTTSDTQPPAK